MKKMTKMVMSLRSEAESLNWSNRAADSTRFLGRPGLGATRRSLLFAISVFCLTANSKGRGIWMEKSFLHSVCKQIILTTGQIFTCHYFDMSFHSFGFGFPHGSLILNDHSIKDGSIHLH